MNKHTAGRAAAAVLLSLAMIFSTACSALPGKASPVSAEVLPFYFISSEDCTDTEVFFMNGNRQIPYVSPETWKSMYLKLCNDGSMQFPADPDVSLELACDGGTVTYTRENGSVMTIDCVKDVVTFSDFDAFTIRSYSATRIDVLHMNGCSDSGEPEYISRVKGSYDRTGGPARIDMTAYGIDFIYLDGRYYLPVQVMSDVLMPLAYVNFLYNTEALMFVDFSTMLIGCDLGDIYYSVEPQERSAELIDFTYGEICMMLDCFFGFREEHRVNSFDEYFSQTFMDCVSLRDMLRGSSTDMETALYYLIAYGIDDLHSCFLLPCFYSGYDADPYIDSAGNCSDKQLTLMEKYQNAREKAYPDGVPAYEEIGNTAYVTFDRFTLPGEDYYAHSADENAEDTFGIIEYAHSRIFREGSPVENVVLDLSCNGGGAEDAAIYVLSWMLGSAGISLEDTFSGATATTYYTADVNMDRAFTDEDNVSGLNLYCLISPCSYSCGNLIPSALKASGMVTLIGQPSSGGACAVQPMTTASGSYFQMSGYKRLCTVQNGSYYHIDRGVAPDFTLSKAESFYDRAALTDYINGLL